MRCLTTSNPTHLYLFGNFNVTHNTAFATQITLANAREGIPVVWYSLEMSKEKLTRRFYPQMGDIITSGMMRDPRLINTDVHVPELVALREELDALPIWVDETSAIPLKKLLARIRMMKRKCRAEYKTDKILFIFDYLQLIKPNPSRQEAEGIKEIIFALRDSVKADPLAHYLVLSQYSKADGFTKKRQRSSADLYGSSAIRHAAQNILLISMEDAGKKSPTSIWTVKSESISSATDARVRSVVCSTAIT